MYNYVFVLWYITSGGSVPMGEFDYQLDCEAAKVTAGVDRNKLQCIRTAVSE